MTVYTARGDEGTTDLRDGTSVPKTNPRIEACGTVDELNALLGAIQPTDFSDLDSHLQAIQNHLHVIQADLANPDNDEEPRIQSDHVDQLEEWIDEVMDELEPLESFVLPGGGETGGNLQHARAVCRRAERRTVALTEDGAINDEVIRYLNRLSDALFVFARLANERDKIFADEPTY